MQGTLGGLFRKNISSVHEGSAVLMTKHLSKAPLSDIITVGIRISTQAFVGGETDLQIIAKTVKKLKQGKGLGSATGDRASRVEKVN